ncbi:recombinase RecA [Candidatus Methylacidiphilum fumarolicum]|uniref:Protein RecA n=2 Tax=Candidatus Methylacidiphilum fumarolicum TaxID=591154 RepID=I0JXE5_METFB|nr:recombinase RecA [Candidatus Methylacidiphilum fumarolicum]MBW6415308.1 recombinase RecA [Candidatus Methylacidiphilum fumarolicum]TFE69287.1 recombinase RecA [Candidatus Methylacidiphilum fumarolicum]TFE72191.1 recombinase RecA [Candidatus Methylacidiphilum fumarolicum]TFE72332.1 recombinase RecA [Candidatus Methylacidiphilum fumarolicum]TFE77013.1 recombinase RecA [Candidatus Methylacidiphilum fumarolicum]
MGNRVEDKSPFKDKSLELAIQSIAKEFGEGSILRLGDDRSRLKIETIPTGCLTIDRALGVGGFPRGRIIEIYGPESSGKTTLALTVIAQAQKMGGVGVIIDVEHALDPHYCRKLGVNMNELLISQPDSGEEALTIAETLIRSNAVDVIVIDSVAALTPRVEIEGQMGDAVVGAQARLMSSALRKLTAQISKAKTVCIFTNQLRDKIGVMFGNPETTPGGKALKFYASVRIDIRKLAQLKGPDGTVYGNRTKLKVVKNKVAPPFTECEFDILYNEGISREGSLIDLAIEEQIIEKRGSWMYFEGTQLGQGREAVVNLLKSDPVLCAKLEAATRGKVFGADASVTSDS